MTSEGSILPEKNEINFIFHLLLMISFIFIFIIIILCGGGGGRFKQQLGQESPSILSAFTLGALL